MDREVTLAACLIVRDEARALPACLASLRGVVDEVVVYDTGSADATAAVARDAGARVVSGVWDGDFSAARNAALAETAADWVLVLDADERVVADAAVLRATLGTASEIDVLAVRVENERPESLEGAYAHRGTRVLRPGAVRFRGRVHETPLLASGGLPRTADLDPAVLTVLHTGYADPATVRAKAHRNAELGRIELDELVASGCTDVAVVAPLLLNLGRSLAGAGREQEAVEAFETLREVAPGTPQWVEGTDFLTRLLLGDGQDELVLLLVDQLRTAGAPEPYCDWLAGQALAQLDRPTEALDLLRRVHRLVDPAGREYGLGQVFEMRALAAALAGERDEAVGALVSAMAGCGRVAGRGPLLLQLAAGMSATEVADRVNAQGREHLDAVVTELRCTGPEGDRIADLVQRSASATAPAR